MYQDDNAVAAFFVLRLCSSNCATVYKRVPGGAHSNARKAPLPHAANVTCQTSFTPSVTSPDPTRNPL
jgi:hypothetical protein